MFVMRISQTSVLKLCQNQRKKRGKSGIDRINRTGKTKYLQKNTEIRRRFEDLQFCPDWD